MTDRILTRDSVPALKSFAQPELSDARVPPTARALERLQQQAYAEAYAQGLAAGHAEGLARANSDVETLLQRFTNWLDALATPLAELDARVEHELVQLVIAMTRQLVRREVKADSGQIVGVVREALTALPSTARNVRVHLNPEDAQLVHERLSEPHGERAWRIVEDPLLARGGCRVTTETSQIDMSLDARLHQIFSQTFGDLRNGEGVAADNGAG
jgi:flagellar assembly protein FliH